MVDMQKKVDQAKANLLKLTKAGKVSVKDKDYIMSFVTEQTANGTALLNRAKKYYYVLGKICSLYGGELYKIDRDGILSLVQTIRTNYVDETSRDYIVILRLLIKYIREQQGFKYDNNEFPKEFKKIKPDTRKYKKKLPRNLLKIDDIKKMADNTNNLRDRALILFLYESGCRIGELLGLRVSDFEADKYGAKMTLPDEGKTGSRTIRILSSSPAISNWLMDHPKRNHNDFKSSYLFCGLWGKNRGYELHYRHVNKLLKETAEKAGVKKPVNPHHFRHSRATELVKNGLNESIIRDYLGWTPDSRQVKTYIHLSGRDTDKAILKMHGMAFKEDSSESEFKPIKCPRCNIQNSPDSKFCSACSLGLDEKSVMEYDQQKDEAMKLGYNIQGMFGDRDFMLKMMNMMAEEWEKHQKKD